MDRGEELGLPEVIELTDAERQDPTYHRTKLLAGDKLEVGRDGCRVPLPWNASAKNLGFGPDQPPHLPQPAWMSQYSVDRQSGLERSTLSMYREAVNLRSKLQTSEDLEWIESGDKDVLEFRRPWRLAYSDECWQEGGPNAKGRGLDDFIAGGSASWRATWRDHCMATCRLDMQPPPCSTDSATGR